MKPQRDEEDRLSFFAGFVVAIGAAGLVGTALIAREPAARLGAFLGVAGSLLAGLVALSLKRWALSRSLQWALGMIGVAFAVRVVFVVGGLFYVMSREASIAAYLMGFFPVYFALQWVEVSYVLDATKRRGPGGFE